LPACFCSAGVVSHAIAADQYAVPDADYCAAAGTSKLVLAENVAELKGEVVHRMNESVAVGDFTAEPLLMTSRRPEAVPQGGVNLA
jgi:hypothetical protein